MMEVSVDTRNVERTKNKILCARGTKRGSFYTLKAMSIFDFQGTAFLADLKI